MKILITGATGMIGSEIVALCHEREIAVNYLTTRREAIVREEMYSGYFWDPEKMEIDTSCFEEITAIINLAGANLAKRWTKKQKKRIRNSRINSLRTLAHGLERIPQHMITSLVSASAIGIYPSSFTRYYTETETETDDSFLGELSAQWEEEADRLERFGIAVAKLRTGLVLSSGGGALPKIARPVKSYMGAAFGSGEQWQSWIHVSDMARVYLFGVEHELRGVYNAVGPNPVTNNKLIREIADALNKPLFLPNVPETLLRLILGEMSLVLLSSQRVSSKKLSDIGFSFRYQNITAALKDLYEPVKPLT